MDVFGSENENPEELELEELSADRLLAYYPDSEGRIDVEVDLSDREIYLSDKGDHDMYMEDLLEELDEREEGNEGESVYQEAKSLLEENYD